MIRGLSGEIFQLVKTDTNDPLRLEPFQAKTSDPAEYWLWLAYVLDVIEQTIPYGDEPDRCHWDHPDDIWKDEAEDYHLEQQHSKSTSLALAEFLRTWRWPRTSSAEPHYARLRLVFARQQAKLLATKSSILAECPAQMDTKQHRSNLLWLLIDVYSTHRGLK